MGGRAAIKRLLGGALPARQHESVPGGGSSTHTAPLQAPVVMVGPERTTTSGGLRSTRTAC
jgi:hypothetical protein